MADQISVASKTLEILFDGLLPGTLGARSIT